MVNNFWGLMGILILSSCSTDTTMNFTEKQLTSEEKGHTIHNTQCFSGDGKWIVFDTRNDDTKIGSTASIGMVNTGTGEIKELYHTQGQTEFGPGVGAATFSPVENRVIFIHGIRNANEQHPYSMTRRTGVSIKTDQPFVPAFMDARNILPPFTTGALRGGTHAHSWSSDGKWISFTYNDYVIEQLAKTDTTVKDMRTVGVMVPSTGIHVHDDGTLENNSGEMFSAVVTRVTVNPAPGSDEIDKAFDECWIGTNGYTKPDGSRQQRAIAFQGNVRDKNNVTRTELFIADLPADITKPRAGEPLEGTEKTGPGVPGGISQRRVTHLPAGIEGPRHWLRSTPDGNTIAFLTKDSTGIVQLFSVSPNGGAVNQITKNLFSVEGAFNFSPDGKCLTYIADHSVFVTELATGSTHRITKKFSDSEKLVGAPVWSYDGKLIAYNRYVKSAAGSFIQIFLLTQN